MSNFFFKVSIENLDNRGSDWSSYCDDELEGE